MQTVKDNHQIGSGGSGAGAAVANQYPYVPEIKENGNTFTASTTPIPNPLPQACESCLRLEADIKKVRNEFSQLKQFENELRQKCESNANAKSCLQAKQKDNDELEKKYVL